MTGVRARVTDRIHVAEVVLARHAPARRGDRVECVAVLGPATHNGRVTAAARDVCGDRVGDEDRRDDARVSGGGGGARRRGWGAARGTRAGAGEDATGAA